MPLRILYFAIVATATFKRFKHFFLALISKKKSLIYIFTEKRVKVVRIKKNKTFKEKNKSLPGSMLPPLDI